MVESPLDGEVGSPLDGEVGPLLNGEARLHWMERWGFHPMEVYRSVVGALAVVFDGRKRHFPGPFGMSPVFAKWQNRSDQFCHFSSTSFTLCFDQGQVLIVNNLQRLMTCER